MEYSMIGSHIEAYPLEEDKLQIFNRNTGKTYTLGKNESNVFQLLNGANTINDISRQCSFYTGQEIDALIKAFSDLGFFEKTKMKLNPFKIKLKLFNPNKLLRTDSPLTIILHCIILFICPLIFIAGIVMNRILINDAMRFYGQAMIGIRELGVAGWILIAFLSLLSLALHESAHMITARKYGVNVPEMGVMLYFLVPCAYTNITGINLLKSKTKRLIVLASGSLVNFAIIGICSIVICTVASQELVSYAAALALANIGTIFLNLMVLLKFDGYYALEVILDEPKLRENAISAVLSLVRTLFAGKKEEKTAFRQMIGEPENTLRYVMYSIYFIFSTGYIPVIMLNTVVPFLTR